MKEKTDLIEELPWNKILDQLHQHYDLILEKHFSDNPEMLALLSMTQISLRYAPKPIETDCSSTWQEDATVWDELGAEVTEYLHAILLEEYRAPVEFVQAMQVGSLGAHFRSPVAKRKSSCTEWHTCKKNPNTKVLVVDCPC